MAAGVARRVVVFQSSQESHGSASIATAGGVAMERVRGDPAGATLAPPPQPRNEAGRQTSRNLTLPAAASQSAYRFARLNAALRRHPPLQ